MKKMKILLVEDEFMISEAVAAILKQENYSVDIADNGECALDCALSGIYDLVLLDIMLPKRDGISVLQEMRLAGLTTPVIMLTAKGEVENKIQGLDCGADDYLAKPCQAGELLARIRAVLRRGGGLRHDGILCLGDISLNPHNLELRAESGSAVLTLKESQLMELLLNYHPNVVTKNIIIEKLWGYDSDVDERLIDKHISLLRKKMKQVQTILCIRVIRGYGYLLENKGRLS